jgi:Uncharacterized protein conserved in bacteria
MVPRRDTHRCLQNAGGTLARLGSGFVTTNRRITDVANEHIKGAISKAQGKVEEGLGKLTRDRKKQVHGEAKQVQGSAQERLGDVQDAVRRPKHKP